MDKNLSTVTRRHCLKWLTASALGVYFAPVLSMSPPRSHQKLFNQLLPNVIPSVSTKIDIQLPKIASQSHQIPILITSQLPNIKHVTIIAQDNPDPKLASFNIQNSKLWLRTNIRLAQSTDVIALVQTQDNQWHYTHQPITVNENGCF